MLFLNIIVPIEIVIGYLDLDSYISKPKQKTELRAGFEITWLTDAASCVVFSKIKRAIKFETMSMKIVSFLKKIKPKN